MSSRRHRVPRGPRRSPETYRIVRRDGHYLSDARRVPFAWTAREPMALAFRSREDAREFVRRNFVSEEVARSVSGIRVVA